MRSAVRKKFILAAAASSAGLLGFVGYPYIAQSFKKQSTVSDYVDLPVATADLTKDILLPESVGAGTDVPVDVSHWFVLSALKSKNPSRRERAIDELARLRRWTDAEFIEIAQALDNQDVVKLARTIDADLRLFLAPPSIDFIKRTVNSEKVEKFLKTILKEVVAESSCSSCANFYTHMSLRVRPDADSIVFDDMNQVDKMMKIESRKRKKSAYNNDLIKLKAVLNNIICGQQQANSMIRSGLMIALAYFRQKYPNDVQMNGLLAQIAANLTYYPMTRDNVFPNGCIHMLTQFSRSEHLELSLPAYKALANLDDEARKLYGSYGNHIYLLAPVHRDSKEAQFDVIFVHGLVGSVFKSWRQGSVCLDGQGNRLDLNANTPTTELLPSSPLESFDDVNTTPGSDISRSKASRCWPKDWLAKDIPGLRILAVDYPTALSSWRTECDTEKDTLKKRAIHVMKQLEAANVGERPIVWVAHSMGGLLTKQMLVLCDEIQQQLQETAETNSKTNQQSDGDHDLPSPEFAKNMLEQTRGVVFYSVPHKGSNLEWIERRNLQKMLMLTTEVIELQKGSPVLVNLHQKFLDLMQKQGDNIKFLTFYENAISSFGVNKVVQWKGILVHEDSLKFELGLNHVLNVDHAHTCKPHARESITYRKTMSLIRSLMPTNKENESDTLLPFMSFVI